MRVQCAACGFSAIFAGGGVVPKPCPKCKAADMTKSANVSACLHCGIPYPTADKTCPQCKIARVVQSTDRESGKSSIPDGSVPPRSS